MQNYLPSLTTNALETMAAINPQQASRLVQVPPEVLIRITDFLSTPDLGSVRLTCRAIERNLFKTFSHEFFRKKQFMVTSDSLQALIDISKHPTLSPCLKHVIITADRVDPGFDRSGFDPELNRRLDAALADHSYLMATGGLRDMLIEAFSNLSNLEIVDIRDFNSTSRTRDGPGTPWRSYGFRTLVASTGASIATNFRSPGDNYVRQLFWAVTAALALAGARPKSIEVLIQSLTPCAWGLDNYSFFIPPRLEKPIGQLLSSLQSLHLTLDFLSHLIASTVMTQKFLSLASNLTWLRLNFRWRDQGSESFLTWLGLKAGQRSANPMDMEPIQLRRLERLDIGQVKVSPKTLLNLVAKFAPSLRSVFFRRVRLVDDKNTSAARINLWAEVLSKMARIPGLNLRMLDLALLWCGTTDGWSDRVYFRNRDRLVTERRCSASAMPFEKAVSQAIDDMDIPWPALGPSSGMRSPQPVISIAIDLSRWQLTYSVEDDQDEENSDDEEMGDE